MALAKPTLFIHKNATQILLNTRRSGLIMPKNYTQEILFFSKLNHRYFCVRAYEKGDRESFCRHFFFLTMDRNNLASFEIPVTTVIHNITDWSSRSIQDAMRSLKAMGELQTIGYKQVRINDLIANKRFVVTDHNGYSGKQPEYTEAGLKVHEELQRLIKETVNTGKREMEMKAILKKVETLEEQNEKILKALDFLMARAKGEDVAQAKTFLTVIEGGKKD